MKLESIKDIKPAILSEDSEARGMDQWVTTEEAASIIGVSTGRVRQYVQDGRLTPREKTDSDHYFRRSQVEALAKQPRERTGRPPGSKSKKDAKDD